MKAPIGFVVVVGVALVIGCSREDLASEPAETSSQAQCGGPEVCVSKCTWRRHDGSCVRTEDFCGPRPVYCYPNCTWERPDGSCVTWDADLCYDGCDFNSSSSSGGGSSSSSSSGGGQECAVKCTWRRADGSCVTTENFCGPAPVRCYPNCTWQRPDGSCVTWDADLCHTG